MNLPFDAFVQRRIGQADAAYQAYLNRGFATADFAGQPQAETLQCRDETDRTNWLGLLLKAQAAVSAGQGDALCDPPIRCTSNRMYAVAYSEVVDRMFALLDQVGAAQAHWWDLKDAIRACPTREGLNDIDLTGGWP